LLGIKGTINLMMDRCEPIFPTPALIVGELTLLLDLSIRKALSPSVGIEQSQRRTEASTDCFKAVKQTARPGMQIFITKTYSLTTNKLLRFRKSVFNTT
jgi:hypothetical protein